LDHFRNQGLNKRSTHSKLSMYEVLEKSITLLHDTTLTLDQVPTPSGKGVNWYLTDGALIGLLRNHAFVPWDDDVDVKVRRDDRKYIYDFIADGIGVFSRDRMVARISPTNPSVLMIGVRNIESGNVTKVEKILFVDVETKLVVDVCIDCQYPKQKHQKKIIPTGKVSVNAPIDPWNKFFFSASRILLNRRMIRMDTRCVAYECSVEPTISFEAQSLSDVYQNISMMRAPSDYILSMCSLPRDLSKCSKRSRFPSVIWVKECIN